MEDGALSGGFFVTYPPQGPLTPAGYAAALAHTWRRLDEIDTTLARFADRIGAAETAADATLLHAEDRRIAFKSLENSYPVGDDLSLVAAFRRRGVRLAGPVHNGSNQLADSATDAARWGGLSALWRRWLGEINRCGIVPDASHASDAAFDQMLDQSAVPILLSHSGARACFDHPRNLDDDRIRRLARAGGVICFPVIFQSAMSTHPARRSVLTRLGRIGELAPDEQATLGTEWHALEAIAPMWQSGFDDYITALLHVVDLAAIDAVGFGANFNGGGGVSGMEGVSRLPRVTERLLGEGLGEDELARVWGFLHHPNGHSEHWTISLSVR